MHWSYIHDQRWSPNEENETGHEIGDPLVTYQGRPHFVFFYIRDSYKCKSCNKEP